MSLNLNTPCTPEEHKARKELLRRLLNETHKLSDRFNKNYKFGDLMGDGAFGFVFSIIRLTDNVELAAKFIVRNKLPKESWVLLDNKELVPVEVHVLKQLNHPNVIKYVEHIMERDFVVLITELHGCSWHTSNPKLDFVKNPGLKFKYRPKKTLECNGRQIGHRTSSDLFECIDARNIEF